MGRILGCGMSVVLLVASLLCSSIDQASAASLLFDRGLPTGNLNNAAGASRSNVAWADNETSSTPAEYWLPGDDFKIAGAGPYHIDTVRVWTVENNSGLTLWGGPQAGTISALSSTFTPTAVTYSGGADYQGSSGAFRQIYQVDFAVDWTVTAGSMYQFFLDGPWSAFAGGGFANAFLHASNAALSVSTQEGSNGEFLWLHDDGTTLTVQTWFSGDGGGTTGWSAGWDKNSDGNVQLFGTPVSEPGTLLFFVSSLLGLVGVGARLRK